MKKFILIIWMSLTVCLAVVGQQQASYTQYMFNGMSINPGYIGSHNGLDIVALSRWQWAGLEGAPNTQTLAMHTDVPNKNIGLGAQFIRDEIAATQTTSVLFGYSYKVGLGNGVLSMGLQGGFQNFKTDLASLYTINPDESFSENTSNMKPNFGAGLFYHNPIFYAGLSAPLLLKNNIEISGENIHTQSRHYFVTSGAVFALSSNIKLKPNVLLKVVDGAPISVDYNMNVLINEILWLGVSLRPPESINFLMELNINQQFRVGYAYDYVIDQTLSEMPASSHELLLNYQFKWFQEKVVTPRYF